VDFGPVIGDRISGSLLALRYIHIVHSLTQAK
jgi:hypothetical protein